MAKSIPFTPTLQSSYQHLFETCIISVDKYPFVDAAVNKILSGKARYVGASKITNVPWYFIGIVHYLEGGCNFNTHLHNGDPLTARTINVPEGRPKNGTPPFTWEASAEDALSTTVGAWINWTIPGVLYKLEGYNGFGYRSPDININTPYLWSFSNQYTEGKFVADHKYSATAVSQQVGAAVILKRLFANQEIQPSVPPKIADIATLAQHVVFAQSHYSEKAEELQIALNMKGANLAVDGKAGKLTSDAVKAVTGNFLIGDPRG